MLKTTLPVLTKPIEVSKTDVIKVAATSRANAVAGAIAGIMRERRSVDVHAIGAGAVNQTVKALAIATNYLQDDGITLACVPHFFELEIEGQTRTAVRFNVWAND